jgi:hypothetical protein
MNAPREDYKVDPIVFRSVGECRLAEAILMKEGQWDPVAQSFLTKEKQLQELSRTFDQLHTTLCYMPQAAYIQQGKDLDFVYPKAPKQLLKQHAIKHSQLTMEDPTSDNIIARSKIAEKNKALRDRDEEGTGLLFDSKEKDDFIRRLEAELIDSAKLGRSHANKQGALQGLRFLENTKTQAVKPSIEHSKIVDLPKIGRSTSRSSLLVELKSTKRKAIEFHQQNSSAQCILNLNTSAQLKSAITKMFGDPKSAEAISREEYERREKEYAEERARALRYQANLLKEERETMERELAHFK